MRGSLLAVAVAIVSSACSSPPPAASTDSPAAKAAAAAPARDVAGSRATLFSVSPEQLSHLQVAPVARTTWTTIVRTTGTVDWDNEHTTQAITQVSGPIVRIVADAGAHVKAGDPLLYVASPDVTNALAAYRKAKNRYDLADRSLARNRDLLAHKALSQRDLESAEADFNDAATDLQAAQQALRVYGVTQAEITDDERQTGALRAELVMRAPLTGTVVQRLVLPGQVIQAGATAAFVISNTSTVWVQGHLYDKDLGAIRVGDTVDIRSASYPDPFHGVVTYIGDMIDPATRTTPVRIVTDNPHGLLKKDLFVDVVIHDRATRDALVVPTAAVLYDEQNFPFVYVRAGQDQFAERKISLGAQRDDTTEVTSGLKAGEAVVSQGSVFLQFANTYQQ